MVSAADFERRIPDLFDRSAYRLELLGEYDSPAVRERVQRFAAEGRIDTGRPRPFLSMVREKIGAGAVMSRTHVIGQMTPYLRYELAAYELNVDAGEDVRILPQDRAGDVELPTFDFWLWDSILASVMLYGHRGAWLGAIMISDPAFVADCCRWRDNAMSYAMPLSEYTEKESAA
jgi:hypothetical protein